MRSKSADPTPALDRRGPLGLSRALLILIAFFFLLPFAFQAARLSLGLKENDVKDWLPSDFPETTELSWFGDHFAGESFVLATWEGCTEDDQRLQLLEQKLRHESLGYDWSGERALHPEWSVQEVQTRRRARQLGHDLQLLYPGDGLTNWGGLQEKWLQSASGLWYFITPNGHLHRWEGSMNGPAAGLRAIKRATDRYELRGQLITALGEPSTDDQVNPFYNDPTLLSAPLFSTVQTGPSIVRDLASEEGPMWPVDSTDPAVKPVIAKRRAISRLTGTLFAPAMRDSFPWTADAFADIVVGDSSNEIADAQQLPEGFRYLVESALNDFAEEHLDDQVDRLSEAPYDVREDAWYAVFDQVGIAPPPRTTAIVVTLTELAKNNLAFALGRGIVGGPRGRLLALAEESGLQSPSAPSLAPPPFDRDETIAASGPPQLRMGGPPVDNIAIDEEGTVTLARLVGYSILVGVTLSYLCFRSLKITVMVFIVGGSAATLSMACVRWTGGRVDAILMSMPSLVYVLGLSGAIHVVNYYRDEVRSRGGRGAAGRALAHAIVPCTLAATTTAIGLASLYISNLAPISNFGIYSAAGVMLTLAILFTYLPAALNVFGPRVGRRKKADSAGEGEGTTPIDEASFAQWWAGVGRWVCDRHALVSVGCLLVLATVAVGIFQTRTSVQLLKLFDGDSRIIRDYAWIEENFGKLVPMELVLRVPPSMRAEQGVAAKSESDVEADTVADVTALPLLERIEAVSRIRTVVQRTLGEPGVDIIGQAMSADTFLPKIPDPPASTSMGNLNHAARLRMTGELTDEGGYRDLLQSDYLRIENGGPYEGSELWRISLRVGALTDVDYGRFIGALRTAVEPVLRAYDTRDQLLRELAKAGAFEVEETGKDKKKENKKGPIVLMIGTVQPPALEDAKLLVAASEGEEETATDASAEKRIDERSIYLSTLADLLRYENVRPMWIDPSSDEKYRPGTKRWTLGIQRAPATVYLGSDSVAFDELPSSPLLINGERVFQTSVRPRLTEGYPDTDPAGAMQVVYTGVVPVVYKAQRTLLTSLGESIGLAFVLIACVMIFLLNPGDNAGQRLRPANFFSGLAAGSVSMIPNVFPVLLVFGAMGHLNTWLPGSFLVDIGTMMTASVAMGVAVDDTIHFLSWFRTYLDRGYERRAAIIETYRRVGPAMTQTTIVGGLGLFVFALSTFTPTQRFGTLMLVLLATALVGDLILLPALLAGPLGRCFKPRNRPAQIDSLEEQDGGTSSETNGSEADDERAEQVAPSDQLMRTDQAESGTDQDADALPRLKLHLPPEVTDSQPVRKGR